MVLKSFVIMYFYALILGTRFLSNQYCSQIHEKTGFSAARFSFKNIPKKIF
jgi:hypothetical protein